MDKNKYIFLDFDGVLNSDSNYRKLQMSGQPTRDDYGTIFDARCIAALKSIVDATDAKIVVTSSWRYLLDLSSLREMWHVRNLPGVVLSNTPTNIVLDPFDNLTRGKEIEAWLKSHNINEDICSYVIIDDENEYMTKQFSHFVWTNPERGLTRKDAERAITILDES